MYVYIKIDRKGHATHTDTQFRSPLGGAPSVEKFRVNKQDGRRAHDAGVLQTLDASLPKGLSVKEGQVNRWNL